MNLSSLVDELLSRLWTELMYLIEDELHRFLHPLEDWMTDLVNRPLPPDWRQRLHAYLDEQHAEGYEIAPEHRPILENHIESWAAFRGMLPRDGTELRRRALIQPLGLVVAPDVPIPPRQRNASLDNSLIVLVAARKRRGKPKSRLPRGGRWISGKPGNGTWKPSTQIFVEGKKVDAIPFRDGMPIFDKWSKGEVSVAITGQNSLDRIEALKVWKANGGGEISNKYVFHHDGATTTKIKYKGVDLVIGRMQLIPKILNEIAHIGSASFARGMIVESERVKHLAREVNDLSIRNKGPLGKIAKRFMSKLPRMPKHIVRAAIPVLGGLLVILDFAENAEAHGVGGAIIRGVPLLGEVVNVYDIASDLATTIEEEARDSVVENQERANQATREATKAAATLTVEEFDRLSKQIRITNPYFEAGSLQEPLENLYNDMHTLILLQLEGKNIAYPDDATSEQKQTESAFNMKLRMARERFEREVRQRTELPGPRPQRPSA